MSERHPILRPALGARLSPGPWEATGDGTVIARDGHVVCVMGHPEEDLGEQEITNGAAILALPDLIAAAKRLAFSAEPTREDWWALHIALGKVEGLTEQQLPNGMKAVAP